MACRAQGTSRRLSHQDTKDIARIRSSRPFYCKAQRTVFWPRRVVYNAFDDPQRRPSDRLHREPIQMTRPNADASVEQRPRRSTMSTIKATVRGGRLEV